MNSYAKAIYCTPRAEIVNFDLQDVLTLSIRDPGETQGGEITVDTGDLNWT